MLIGGRLTLSIPEQRLAAPARRRPRPRRDQAARRSLRGDDRRRRSLCGCASRCSSGWRGTAGSASSAGAARRSSVPRSSSVASRGDAHGLGELRHDRPRLPGGGGGRGRGDRGRRHAPRPDRPEPVRSVLVRRGRAAPRCGAASRRGTSTREDDDRRRAGARARPDLRRRLVAARARAVHRARERGRVRDAPDAAPASPRARADPVGDPHRAGTHGRDALRDRRCVGRLRVDRRPGHAGHRTGRDCDDALRPNRRRARRADAGAPAAAPRGHGAAHPAGSEPCELLAEAHSRRRDHRLGDEGAVPLRLGAGADTPVPGRLHVPRGREGDRLERAAVDLADAAPAGTVVEVGPGGPVVACGEGALVLEEIQTSAGELEVGARLG